MLQILLPGFLSPQFFFSPGELCDHRVLGQPETFEDKVEGVADADRKIAHCPSTHPSIHPSVRLSISMHCFTDSFTMHLLLRKALRIQR